MPRSLSDWLAWGLIFMVWNATRIFVGACAAIVLVMFVWWVWR